MSDTPYDQDADDYEYDQDADDYEELTFVCSRCGEHCVEDGVDIHICSTSRRPSQEDKAKISEWPRHTPWPEAKEAEVRKALNVGWFGPLTHEISQIVSHVLISRHPRIGQLLTYSGDNPELPKGMQSIGPHPDNPELWACLAGGTGRPDWIKLANLAPREQK